MTTDSMIAKYYGSNSTVCSDCRRRCLYTELIVLDGRLLCGSCTEVCDVCDREVPLVDVTFHSNDPYKRVHCPACEKVRVPLLSHCDDCGNLFDREVMIHTFEGQSYCEPCWTVSNGEYQEVFVPEFVGNREFYYQ